MRGRSAPSRRPAVLQCAADDSSGKYPDFVRSDRKLPHNVRIRPVRCIYWNRKGAPHRHNCLIFRQTLIALAATAAVAFAVEFTFEIPPVPVSLDLAGQQITLTVSGLVSGSPAPPGPGDQTFKVKLLADLGDFQGHLTSILQTELNKSDHCGERLSIRNATLTPDSPAGLLAVQLHFEKWICIRALGPDSAKKLVGGDATVRMKLTPRIDDAASDKTVATRQTIRLDAEILNIDAEGKLGEILRSGTVGPALREKIRESLLAAVQKSTQLDGVIPAEAQRFVTLQTIAFGDRGNGRLKLDFAGRMQLPGEQIASVLDQLGNRK